MRQRMRGQTEDEGTEATDRGSGDRQRIRGQTEDETDDEGTDRG